jgi:hypothetical protein
MQNRANTTDSKAPGTLSQWLPFWFGTALVFFLLASLFGVMMRYVFVWPLPGLHYKYILHAHSHLALMGWGFTVLSGLLIATFIPKTRAVRGYKWVLGVHILSGTGMLIFFPYQGYGAFSIAFSTLHLGAAYLFAYLFLKDVREQKLSTSGMLAAWAVRWMLISSLGLWALGPLGIYLGKTHPIYLSSIQFFLHFQIHGWFVYAILALLLAQYQKMGRHYHPRPYTFLFLQFSLVFTLALSLHWIHPHPGFVWINRLGVLMQAAAFWWYLAPLLAKWEGKQTNSQGIIRILWMTGLLSLTAKAFFQLLTQHPVVLELSFTIRNFFIGFVHLIMLGAVSASALSLLLSGNYLPAKRTALFGYGIFLLAFWSSECLLFAQGALLWLERGFLPAYHETLFFASLLFPLSLIIILLQMWGSHSHRNIPSSSSSSSIPINQTKQYNH